jgi:acyl-CoA synthetase (NDP forming)
LISVGNVSDLTITDALKEVLKDKGTSCVIIYAESLKDGRKFMKACEKSKKPVFILKSGITEEGVRAAATHTGSLAGTDIIYDAAFKQCNAKRVESLTELINAGITFDKYGYFHDNALIITNAGGPGILLTDALAGQGVKIPKLPKKLIEKLNIELKGISWSKNNPIDVIGDAQANRYAKALRAVSKYNFYDEVIVVLTPQGMTEPLKTAQEIVAFAQEVRKPVVTCFIGGERVKNAITYLENEGLMNFDNIHELAATIRNLFSSNF